MEHLNSGHDIPESSLPAHHNRKSPSALRLILRGFQNILSIDTAMKTPSTYSCAIVCLLCSISGLSQAADRKLPARVSFNAHIRPIMSNTCFTCHGPDEEDNESELRLDSFESATGKVPSSDETRGIVPGKPDLSEVYLRLISDSDDERMPPADFRHQLTDYDKALFRKWIEQGAEYQQHWSYSPLIKPAVPEPTVLAKEVENEIDAFIASKLEAKDLTPADVAEKATLLRRLSLDLTGLPPTLQEITAFQDDRSPDAYSNQVERLLASPAFGERMASHWLDLVRFADTVGFHGDQNQRAFPYRDYVIRSFNQNKPFHEFTKEQLAGDLLPNPTAEQLTATGFLRLNMVTREGGAQPGEYLAKYKADRVRSVGTAFLGVTMGCCECHNHKYDPFTAKDFYSLGAFFDDLQQWGVYSNYSYTPNPDLQGYNNDYPFPPELRVTSESALAEIRALQQERDQRLMNQIDLDAAQVKARELWADQVVEFLKSHPDGWKILPPDSTVATHKTTSQLQDDGSVLLMGKGDPKEVVTAEFTFPEATHLSSLRLEILPSQQHKGNTGRSESGKFQVTVTASLQPSTPELLTKVSPVLPASAANSDPAKTTERIAAKPAAGATQPIKWAHANADRFSPDGFRSGAPKLDIAKRWKSGPFRWQLPKDEAKQVHTAVFQFAEPISANPGDRLTINLATSDVGRFRLAISPVADAIPGQDAVDQRIHKSLATSAVQRTFDQRSAVVSAWHRSTTDAAKGNEIAKQYQRKIDTLRSGLVKTLIAQTLTEDKIPESRVLPRGDWQDTSGEPAPPAVPHFLPQPKAGDNQRLNRLDLAAWLTSKENPLTARHFANRTWKQFFGTGLSSKLDDLGNQGEWPSHPELLDWLAAEFIDSGWDVKHMVRLMVTSRTYRRTAAERSDLAEVDPYNRLLGQQSARRLPAELIRDNALAISGLLRTDYVGGPSIFPYQPGGYYSNLQFPNRTYAASTDFRQYRRGVYMHWQRTFLHPMLVNFDAPSRDECTADRTTSNSPQQALTLLNAPSFSEASVAFALRLQNLHEISDLHSIMDTGFQLAVARPAEPQELESLQSLYEQQLKYFQANPTEADAYVGNLKQSNFTASDPQPSNVQTAALAMVCRVILNLHETITRY